MRKKMKKRMAKALSVLLAALAVVAFMPQMSAPVYADPVQDGDELAVYITFKVVGGGWNDGSTKDKVVRLARDVDEDKALQLASSQIPGAGAKPFYGYEAGKWTQKPFDTYAELHGQIPNDDRNFDNDVTYTYTYVRKSSIEYPTVTFKVVNGKWDDGTTAPKTVKLGSSDFYTAKLTASQIPAVGKKPNKDYQAGSWDVKPSTSTAIEKDTTFTYTYKPESKQVKELLMAGMTAKGSNSLVISWNKVKGAEGYDIFFIRCGKDAPEKVKTIKGNKTFSWTKSGLKKKAAYKARVKAWVKKDGKKTYIKTSPIAHAYASGCNNNHTIAKSVTVNRTSVTLKKGKTQKIEAEVNKLNDEKKIMPAIHAPELRYKSSDTKIAKVSRSGKITAKGKGTCYVYAYAVNGVYKKVKVTVK